MELAEFTDVLSDRQNNFVGIHFGEHKKKPHISVVKCWKDVYCRILVINGTIDEEKAKRYREILNETPERQWIACWNGDAIAIIGRRNTIGEDIVAVLHGASRINDLMFYTRPDLAYGWLTLGIKKLIPENNYIVDGPETGFTVADLI